MVGPHHQSALSVRKSLSPRAVSLSACVTVYAADEDKAARKVQAKIDAGSLDDDLEMENYESGLSIPYSDVKAFFDYGFNNLHIQNVDASIEDVDPVDMLKAEVEELQSSISRNTDAMSKRDKERKFAIKAVTALAGLVKRAAADLSVPEYYANRLEHDLTARGESDFLTDNADWW